MTLFPNRLTQGVGASVASFSALFLLVLAANFFAVGGLRALQLSAWGAFFALGVLWAPCFSGRFAYVLRLISFIGLTAGFLHAAVRGFLLEVYGAVPTSSIVIEALANTHASEIREFFQNGVADVAFWAFFALLFTLLSAFLLFRKPVSCTSQTGVCGINAVKSDLYVKSSSERSEKTSPDIAQPASSAHSEGDLSSGALRSKAPCGVRTRSARRMFWAISLVFTLTFILSLSFRSWRNHLPLFQWVTLVQKVAAQQSAWTEELAQREREWQDALSLVKSAPNSSVNTIVLVIGESTNRDNMSLYGYGRPTTPKLTASAQSGRIFWAKEAWSVKPSTVASFDSMFTFPLGGRGREEDGNVLAFFKAAGWHITWLSNQDDLAIKSQYSFWADRLVLLNQTEGRSSVSLDERILEPLAQALESPQPKHLIVVHLIGIHPHYELRYPDGWRGAWSEEDTVQKVLREQGRSLRTRLARNQYDLAMLYQDEVISRTLTLTERSKDAARAVWIYLADHGSETGGTLDRTGHSPTTLSGYKIPFLLWVGDDAKRQELSEDADRLQFFRADWLDQLLLDIAGIRNPATTPVESIYSPDYRYTEPGVIQAIREKKASEN